MADEKAKNTQRRDTLVALQKAAQSSWAASRVFECDAAAAGAPKFFGNFPYPYMNGLLHLGHAFSLSKVEFATAYARLQGKHALFPFAFHCTGMPIKAAADKIAREMQLYGNPPVFPAAEEESDAAPAPTATAGDADPSIFKSKKSKSAAKTAKAATQWEIMRLSGVPDSDIAAFADPAHWLNHFPPLGQRDVRALGCGVDWRRSFITTSANPYYDSFVRWQFNSLKKRGKVVRDKRYAVFSPLDGQPCADHDRASGEGVGPQEYTLIKLRVLPECLEQGPLAPLAGRHVFLGAATLRPETMYGQTNVWVLPDGQYGAFVMADDSVLIITARAARNLSYQERTAVAGKPECLLDVSGADLVGLKLSAPLCQHEVIYALPMLTILTNKGTGIVTSVPSDAPDDHMALQDLKAKPALRAKYGVTDAMVLPFEPVPTILIPEFGNLSAVTVCERLKIKSQNDRTALDEAKHLTYLKGFTEGVMVAGPYAGSAVRDVKATIRGELLTAGLAIPYCEPEKPVTSRSGDDCVVALTDQWYLQYGEDSWRELTLGCLSQMDTVHSEARNAFEGTLSWLRQWACSRSFGLGTRIPWDDSFVIESLSDSTIYMAYYTVAHLLQRGDMYGGAGGGGVDPQLLTDAVWDCVFLEGPEPAEAAFPRSLLEQMRAEFTFWYPFDLRVSGKDLIQNHLTFCLYSHTALFPPSHWPRAVRCNGHLLLNGDKMSKSTGNFKTLEQACEEYGADAVRVALADAGDGLDDANFEESTANAAVLRLTRELAWAEEVLASLAGGQLRRGEEGDAGAAFADSVFAAELNCCVHAAQRAYDATAFRDALKASYFDLHNARDAYRVLAGPHGMHAALVQRYLDLSARLLAPIAPHWAEHVWTVLLGNQGTVLKSNWPEAAGEDGALRSAAAYLNDQVVEWRRLMTKALQPPKQNKSAPVDAQPPAAQPTRVSSLEVYVSPRYEGWHAGCLALLAQSYDAAGNAFPPDAQLLAAVKAGPLADVADAKSAAKMVMPFLKFKMDAAKAGGGLAALQPQLAFDEAQVLRQNAQYVCRTLGLDSFQVHSVLDQAQRDAAPAAAKAGDATPGNPGCVFGFE